MADDDGTGWATDLDVARHVHAAGTRYLEAQLQAALAADQRAATGASLLLATAIAVLGASFAAPTQSLSVGAFAAGLMLLASAGLCAISFRPVSFYYPGNEPRCWIGDTHNDLRESIANECAYIQEMIEDNLTIIVGNAAIFRLALCVGLFSPVVGVVVVSLS